MNIHARAIDLYTFDTDIMKPWYPLSWRVHCKNKNITVIEYMYKYKYNINSKTNTIFIWNSDNFLCDLTWPAAISKPPILGQNFEA